MLFVSFRVLGTSAVVGQLILAVLVHVLVVSDLVGQPLRLVLRLVETLNAIRRLAVITLTVTQVSSFLRHDRFLGRRPLHALACSRILAGWWRRKGAIVVGDNWITTCSATMFECAVVRRETSGGIGPTTASLS